jgi:hypothetical protein
MSPRLPPGTMRVVLMLCQVGDRMTDSSSEWQVVERPYTMAGGKNVQVRVQRRDEPGVTETRMWGPYERIALLHRPRRTKAQPGDSRSRVMS